MIFRAFKEKSNQKHINGLLNSRILRVDQNKIESVGVILNSNEFNDLEAFGKLFKELDILSPKIKIISFVKEPKNIENSWDVLFSPKDFGWKGTIKNNDLQGFLDMEFDALISFYTEDSLDLHLVTARSKAKFKIGISNLEPRLNDLILNVNPKDFDLFKSELKKYLTILKKI